MISLLKITHKKILKSPSLWISLIFIVFFLAFAPKALGSASGSIQAANSLSLQVASAIIITGLLITVMTSFGESFVKIKNSLIFQNIQLNNKPKYQFYLATILPVVVFSVLIFIVSLSLLSIFDLLSLIGQEKNIIDWSNIQFGYVVLSLITTVSLGITLSLLFSAIAKSDNTYTALVWGYLFLIFFFGGSSVPIFLIRGDDPLKVFMYLSMCIPNSYSNFLFINAMTGQIEFISGNIDVTYILDIVIPIVLTIVLISVRQLILLKKK